MAKLGFMQDLIRGIKKIVAVDEPKTTVVKETVVSAAPVANVAPLLKRAFMSLEDGEWKKADEFCEQVLNQDPENAQAYLGKLMAELKVRKQDDLKNCKEPFDDNNNYKKAVRFGDEKLKSALTGYIEHIKIRLENKLIEDIYNDAMSAMTSAISENQFINAANIFATIEDFKDSSILRAQCLEKAEAARKDAILAEGKSCMTGTLVFNYEYAIKLLKPISGWRDADKQISACQNKIKELVVEKERLAEIARMEAERKAKRNKKIAIITTPIVCVIITFIIVLNTVIIPNNKYNDALSLMNMGKYSEAISAFEKLDGYKDSISKINECVVASIDAKYNTAINLIKEEKYAEAISIFEELDGYKDSVLKILNIETYVNNQAKELYLSGKIEEAAKLAESVGLPIAEAYKCVLNENYQQAIEKGLSHIIIPNGVTSIGNRAFSGCFKLTSITIPNSVTSIGDGAFGGCSSLTSITIPDSVTSIGEFAFYNCSSLTTITIPDSVTNLGTGAFCSCSSLTSITIPNSVTSIGEWTFNGCSSLTSIHIPSSVTSIGKCAFEDCSTLTSITIPNSVTSIGSFVFYGCSSLTRINFNGTKAQWNAIKKDSYWNNGTPSYTIYCTDGNISK